MRTDTEKMHEATISCAYMFRGGAYGSPDRALRSLRRRKPALRMGLTNPEVEQLFTLALKVVDDSLEFKDTQVRGDYAKETTSGWIEAEAMDELGRLMTRYLRERNPLAPTVFIERSVNRIAYRYHLS